MTSTTPIPGWWTNCSLFDEALTRWTNLSKVFIRCRVSATILQVLMSLKCVVFGTGTAHEAFMLNMYPMMVNTLSGLHLRSLELIPSETATSHTLML